MPVSPSEDSPAAREELAWFDEFASSTPRIAQLFARLIFRERSVAAALEKPEMLPVKMLASLAGLSSCSRIDSTSVPAEALPMTAEATQLINEALKLPPAAREAIADFLLETVPWRQTLTQLPLETMAQVEEIRARVRAGTEPCQTMTREDIQAWIQGMREKLRAPDRPHPII